MGKNRKCDKNGNAIECDTRTASVCVCAWKMWEIASSGCLEQKWLTPNSWDRGE